MCLRLSAGCSLLVFAASLAAQSSVPLSSLRDPAVLAQRELAAREPLPRSRAEAESRQREVRAKMLHLLGPLPERTPLNPVVMGETSLPGLRIQKILFDSQPGFHVTALLYLPDTTLEHSGFPAIVMAPGHSPAGKAGDFAFAAAFARNGFAVLSYDPIGQGERLQYPDPKDPARSLAQRPTGEHGEASLQPILLGESVARYFLWDGMRAVDYLETRPEIDPHRIGAFGCSGGGSMTALLGALDPRVQAVGTACYLTSFETLLPTAGPQDGEQSTPGWIAAGLDFPDWVELAAPKPYAIIATESDMFPFAGAKTTEAESRRFYDLFDADRKLAFLTGPGGHGNLKPILPRILKFFIDALQPKPFAPVYDDQSPAEKPQPSALQVTPTGQVSTFDPRSETVFSLNLKHAATLRLAHPEGRRDLQQRIIKVTGIGSRASAATPVQKPDRKLSEQPESRAMVSKAEAINEPGGDSLRWRVSLPRRDGTRLSGVLTVPQRAVSPRLTLLLSSPATRAADEAHASALAAAGAEVLQILPEPADPGKAEIKAAVLGPWYLPGLRLELLGRTILGQRLGDVLLAADYLAGLRSPHEQGIASEAAGHMALVLLHAAAMNPRLLPPDLTNLPPAYAETLANSLPRDLPEDLLPGVLLQYDVPDLLGFVGDGRP